MLKRNLGRCLASLNMSKEALSCFNNALELDPKNTKAMYNSALLLCKLGETVKARELLINALKLNPNYEKDRTLLTWIPKRDIGVDSPPCLQRIWCTIRDGKLILHTSWRSRDIFRAMHMNMLAMTELQKRISEEVGVEVGSYVDFSNSAHIYEKTYWDVERFINVLERRRGSEVNSA